MSFDGFYLLLLFILLILSHFLTIIKHLLNHKIYQEYTGAFDMLYYTTKQVPS